MPTTQYIGARYVPLIFQNPDDNSNDWKAGVSYEPLTIVSYAGGSYTSKTTVPSSVGNPVDNPSYWVAIGLYSGQTAINTNSINQIRYAIASHSEAGNTCTEHRDAGDIVWIAGVLYRCTAEVNVNDTYTEGINITQIYDMAEALDAIAADMTQAQSDISDLSGDYTTLSGTVTSLQTQSNADHAAITSNKINAVESVVWIGDSYTSAGSLGADVDKRFSTKVSAALGLTEHNYAVGGTGFCYGPTPYPDQVTAAIADFTNNNYNPDKVKYCFVIGNRNDGDGSYSYSQYSGAVESVVNALSAYFTKAKIVIIPALWDWKLCKTAVIRYAQIIDEVVAKYNNVLYFSDAFTWLTGHADKVLWQAGADVHPTVAGHQIIATHIINCLSGNNYNETIFYEFTPTTTHADISDAYCCIKVINGIAYFQFKFKSSNANLGGNLMTLDIGNLYIHSTYIIDTQVYTEIHNKTSNNGKALVTVNEVTNKTGDSTGTFTLNVYSYNSNNGYDTSSWNWLEIAVPYGLQRTTYN